MNLPAKSASCRATRRGKGIWISPHMLLAQTQFVRTERVYSTDFWIFAFWVKSFIIVVLREEVLFLCKSGVIFFIQIWTPIYERLRHWDTLKYVYIGDLRIWQEEVRLHNRESSRKDPQAPGGAVVRGAVTEGGHRVEFWMTSVCACKTKSHFRSLEQYFPVQPRSLPPFLPLFLTLFFIFFYVFFWSNESEMLPVFEVRPFSAGLLTFF